MPQNESGYEYEVGETTSVFDVLSGKEAVKVEHRIAIPAKTLVISGLFVLFTALVWKVLGVKN